MYGNGQNNRTALYRDVANHANLLNNISLLKESGFGFCTAMSSDVQKRSS